MKCKHPNCRQECNSEFCTKLCETRFLRNTKRLKHKLKAIEYLGGRCKRCGYKDDLEMLNFHHLDPSDKIYDVTKYLSKGFAFVRAELNKCILLCLNCHTIVHRTKDLKKIESKNERMRKSNELFIKNLLDESNRYLIKSEKEIKDWYKKGKTKYRNTINSL